MSGKVFLLRTSDKGLGLPLVKSTLWNSQAYCKTALEALMELRSQASVFLRTAGALPSTSSREGVKTLRPQKGVALGGSPVSSTLPTHRAQTPLGVTEKLSEGENQAASPTEQFHSLAIQDTALFLAFAKLK